VVKWSGGRVAQRRQSAARRAKCWRGQSPAAATRPQSGTVPAAEQRVERLLERLLRHLPGHLPGHLPRHWVERLPSYLPRHLPGHWVGRWAGYLVEYLPEHWVDYLPIRGGPCFT
jgi:hypothetical protein